MQKTPTVTIIGRPNVGKSSLFNRIVGIRQAITFDVPGTTRDRIFAEVEWGNKFFNLIDTAGFIHDFYGIEEADIEKKAQEQILQSLEESDLILFVVDAKSSLTAHDEKIAKLIRSFKRKTILVINKVDSQQRLGNLYDFEKLGFEKHVAVSAISGSRSGELLDLICGEVGAPAIGERRNSSLHLAIIGRPNVGKSTLFNAIAKSNMAIVSETAGTTRDAQHIKVCLRNRSSEVKFEIIDTAGLRRRGKIGSGLERFSYIRTLESIDEADIVVLVADASEGVTRGDAHLGQIALEKGKKLIVVLNKIDRLQYKTKEEIGNLYRFKNLSKCTNIAISAKEYENIELLEKEIIGAFRDKTSNYTELRQKP